MRNDADAWWFVILCIVAAIATSVIGAWDHECKNRGGHLVVISIGGEAGCRDTRTP